MRQKLQELVEEAVLVRQGNYSHASYRVFDAAVERARRRRAGTQDGPIVGEAVLPGTGNWGSWATTHAGITDPEALVPARDVALVFHAPDGQDWVSNFD
ncbi:hypothetical protein [Salinispora tropica]|uniref:hypothetical protein n=1 Tax=Salinispora tropica TaxID=168695 RepID=UPI0004909C58|nr:hypothetical protein [Salinispora tropica]